MNEGGMKKERMENLYGHVQGIADAFLYQNTVMVKIIIEFSKMKNLNEYLIGKERSA